MKSNNIQENMDNLIRDITKAGSIPKSEARRRIKTLLKAQREQIIKVIENIEEFEETYCEKDEHLLREIKKYILKELKNL